MIEYKTDILKLLKERGYSQSRILKDGLLPGQTLHNIRHKKPVSMDTLNKICIMTKTQPGDIIKVTPTPEELKELY